MLPSGRIPAMSIAGGAVLALSFLALRASFAGAGHPRPDEDREVASAAGSPTAATRQARTVPSSPSATVMNDDRRVHITPVATAASVADALDNGAVTFEEHTQAVFNTMACLDEMGIEHTEPVYEESQGQYRYSVTNPRGTDPRDVSAYDECWMTYERDIQAAWVQQNGARRIWEVEVVNEEGSLQCAAEFGIEANSFADIQALKLEHPQDPAIQHCFLIGTMGFDPSVQNGTDP